jgi:hypothetical protein
MEIGGGLYREICVAPAWNRLLGSGGRAALALCSFSQDIVLHAYGDIDQHDLGYADFHKNNVQLRLTNRGTDIEFIYYHPLSRPLMRPQTAQLPYLNPLKVHSQTALRFGTIEGDVIVEAERSVYDPQSPHSAVEFSANGSTADELVIVLNKAELFSMAAIADEKTAVQRIFKNRSTVAIVVKNGPFGANLYEASGRRTHIPAYLSSRVFKIGTGDVFSAIFAWSWSEKRRSLVDSANLASVAVANYVNSRELPFKEDFELNLTPIRSKRPGRVILLGKESNLGKRYLFQEAKYCLEELDVQVIAWSDQEKQLAWLRDYNESSVLVLADTFSSIEEVNKISALAGRRKIVILSEEHLAISTDDKSTILDDFTSAIYFSAWSSMT